MGRREELGRLDESDLFMELIRDVANELDINILCHKILVNVGLLTHADRGSLFLAKGPLDDRYLVAKLFDVTQDTELEEAIQRAKNEEIKIPFGIGIAGYVAQTKEIINIKDAYKVSPHSFDRFTYRSVTQPCKSNRASRTKNIINFVNNYLINYAFHIPNVCQN